MPPSVGGVVNHKQLTVPLDGSQPFNRRARLATTRSGRRIAPARRSALGTPDHIADRRAQPAEYAHLGDIGAGDQRHLDRLEIGGGDH